MNLLGSESFRLIWFHSIEILCSFGVCYSSTLHAFVVYVSFKLEQSLCNQAVRLVATEFLKKTFIIFCSLDSVKEAICHTHECAGGNSKFEPFRF